MSVCYRLELDKDNKVESIILAYRGMAETTKRWIKTEQFLIGKKWIRDIVEQAMEYIDQDFNPISDFRGSAEFRRVVARNLLMKFYSEIEKGAK